MADLMTYGPRAAIVADPEGVGAEFARTLAHYGFDLVRDSAADRDRVVLELHKASRQPVNLDN